MAAETGFSIDGTVYEVPSLDSFTMDEAQVLYNYSNLTLEDFAGDDDEALAQKVKNPGFMRALMHVAYQRGNPKLPAERVKALVGAANVITSLETLASDQEDDAVPPASTSEPDKPSQTGSLENDNSTPPKPETPGNDSESASDGLAAGLHRIGGSRSESSFTSPPTSSVA